MSDSTDARAYRLQQAEVLLREARPTRGAEGSWLPPQENFHTTKISPASTTQEGQGA